MSLEQIIAGLFLAGVLFTLKMIFNRIDKNEKDLKEFRKEIDTKICTSYDTIRDEYKDITQKMETNKQEILSTVLGLTKGAVPLTHCEAKQELWGERFNNMMDKFDRYLENDEKEHGQIVDTMTKNASARTQQMVDLSERISEMSDCIKKLQHDEKCDKP